MRVLLLFTYMMSLKSWENARILSREIELYNKLSNMGVSYTFMTYGSEDEYKYNSKLNNIKIIPILKKIKSPIPKIPFIKMLFLPFMLKDIIKNNDLIKTNQINGLLIGVISKLFFKQKLIIRGGYEWLRNHIWLYNKTGFINRFKYIFKYFWIFLYELIGYKLADGIILTNKNDIKFIIKTFRLKNKERKNKIMLLQNYINTNIFKSINIPKLEKHILYVGRISREKNIGIILDAFKDLEGFTLDIVSNDQLENIHIAKINKYKIKVEHLGSFHNTEIPNILNNYKILILLSTSEGNPKALLEAMSCGLACIGAEVPGIKDILEHKVNGYLCKLDSNSLRDAIYSLYNDNVLISKIGKKARRYVLNNCSLEKISLSELNFYKEILGQ